MVSYRLKNNVHSEYQLQIFFPVSQRRTCIQENTMQIPGASFSSKMIVLSYSLPPHGDNNIVFSPMDAKYYTSYFLLGQCEFYLTH